MHHSKHEPTSGGPSGLLLWLGVFAIALVTVLSRTGASFPRFGEAAHYIAISGALIGIAGWLLRLFVPSGSGRARRKRSAVALDATVVGGFAVAALVPARVWQALDFAGQLETALLGGLMLWLVVTRSLERGRGRGHD